WRDPAPVRIAASVPLPVSNGTDGGGEGVVVESSRPYSVWRTLAPTAWIPELWGGDAAGTFVGVSTCGVDVVGRYTWAATVGVQPSNGLVRGSVGVGTAVLGNPRLDVVLSRDYDDIGPIRLPDGSLRDFIERQDDIGVVATFVRQRWRNSLALALGGEREQRRRTVLQAPDPVRLRDPRDALTILIARAGFANYRRQPFSISREDGFALNVGV